MTTRRDILRMQVTGLSKVLAGDQSCLFRPWFKSWHQGYKRLPSGGEGLAAWQARHSLAVHELADRLEREGCEVFIEDQNWFDTMSASGSVLTGKPDVIALHPDGSATVYDVKTGTPRPSDEIQVKLYVLLLPRSDHQRWRGVSFDGAVVYPGADDVRVGSGDITGEFIEQVAAYMTRIVAPEAGRAVPSIRECQWCELSRDHCPERMEDSSMPAAG